MMNWSSFQRMQVFAAGLVVVASTARGGDTRFDAWAEELAAQAMCADPEAATITQYFSGDEQDALDRRLTPITKEYRLERVAFARRALEALASFDLEKLDAQQRVSAQLIEWHMQQVVESQPFEDHDFVFEQFRGLHVRLVRFLSQYHPIRTRRDAENYLARLGEVAGKIAA